MPSPLSAISTTASWSCTDVGTNKKRGKPLVVQIEELAGKLSEVLRRARADECTFNQLTVSSIPVDLYRQDTPTNHRARQMGGGTVAARLRHCNFGTAPERHYVFCGSPILSGGAIRIKVLCFV